MFEGSCVALVTPMTAAGEIDESALENLIEWHIQEETAAIVMAGTTGEAPTLTPQEEQRLFTLACKIAKKRIPILAGTGTYSTATTIAKTQAAQAIGVDACLIVTPYYNRPTQEGLIQHYSAIAQAVDVPILLYNNPTRTMCELHGSTVAALSEIPSIIGIKEGSGNVERLKELAEVCEPGFLFYSGDDPTCYEFMRRGGKGVISITSNVVPRLMQKMCRYALAKDDEKAKALDSTMQVLHRLLLVETNPIPIKWALHYLGKIGVGIRLPLTTLSMEHHDKLKQALQSAGLYSPQFNF